MTNRTVYLYRAFPDKISNFLKDNLSGVYFRLGSNLVAIEINTVIDTKFRQKIEKDYSLREFEIEQTKFLALVQLLPKIGAHLTEVLISRRYASDYEDQLNEAIRAQDFDKVCNIITECWNAGANIEAIEFLLNRNRIRFSRLAELDVSSDNPDISVILNEMPVGVLTGVVRDGDY